MDCRIVDFHTPSTLVGVLLNSNQRSDYILLRNTFKLFYKATSIRQDFILIVVDHVNVIKLKKSGDAILSAFIKYMRIKLLSSNNTVVERTVICVDALVKNCGYHIHHLVERKLFIKTMSIIGRRKLRQISYTQDRRIGLILMDTLQAWGEAFYPRRLLYPNIYNTYINLKYKYHIQFIRPDFDPTRVPIFLGPCSRSEYDKMKQSVVLITHSDSFPSYETVDHMVSSIMPQDYNIPSSYDKEYSYNTSSYDETSFNTCSQKNNSKSVMVKSSILDHDLLVFDTYDVLPTITTDNTGKSDKVYTTQSSLSSDKTNTTSSYTNDSTRSYLSANSGSSNNNNHSMISSCVPSTSSYPTSSAVYSPHLSPPPPPPLLLPMKMTSPSYAYSTSSHSLIPYGSNYHTLPPASTTTTTTYNYYDRNTDHYPYSMISYTTKPTTDMISYNTTKTTASRPVHSYHQSHPYSHEFHPTLSPLPTTTAITNMDLVPYNATTTTMISHPSIGSNSADMMSTSTTSTSSTREMMIGNPYKIARDSDYYSHYDIMTNEPLRNTQTNEIHVDHYTLSTISNTTTSTSTSGKRIMPSSKNENNHAVSPSDDSDRDININIDWAQYGHIKCPESESTSKSLTATTNQAYNNVDDKQNAKLSTKYNKSRHSLKSAPNLQNDNKSNIGNTVNDSSINEVLCDVITSMKHRLLTTPPSSSKVKPQEEIFSRAHTLKSLSTSDTLIMGTDKNLTNDMQVKVSLSLNSSSSNQPLYTIASDITTTSTTATTSTTTDPVIPYNIKSDVSKMTCTPTCALKPPTPTPLADTSQTVSSSSSSHICSSPSLSSLSSPSQSLSSSTTNNNSSVYIPPASDPSAVYVYYGNHRIVSKKV